MAELEKQPPSSTPAFKGSCACGRITYDCLEPPLTGQTTVCHCMTCRKLSGGPFQAFTHVGAKDVILYDQKEKLRYEGLPKNNMGGIVYVNFSKVGERAFCASCYSPLAMRYKHEPESVGMTLGMVDEESIRDAEVKRLLGLDKHIFTSQKVWWMDIDKDGLPQRERFGGSFEEDMTAFERGKEKAGS